MKRLDTTQRDQRIYDLYLQNLTPLQLSERFRLPRQTIHRIIERQLPKREPMYVF